MAKLVIIYGPTASGKSDLAIELAKRLDTFVISADSMQVYRGMDIGTGKLTCEEMNGVRHFLIDVRNPDQPYSAGDFVRDTLDVLEQEKPDTAIVAGGTGMYLQSLLRGINDLPAVPEDLVEEFSRKDTEKILEKLRKIDPESASRVSSNDRKRIMRLLLLSVHSGKPYSKLLEETATIRFQGSYSVYLIKDDREKLYKRIRQRINDMLETGWEREVRDLLKNFPEDSYGFQQALGYRELIKYVNGEEKYEQCIVRIKQITCNYAKRQITWFNKFPEGVTIEYGHPVLNTDRIEKEQKNKERG